MGSIPIRCKGSCLCPWTCGRMVYAALLKSVRLLGNMGSNPITSFFFNLCGGMVDAEDSKSFIVKCEGSSPSMGMYMVPLV